MARWSLILGLVACNLVVLQVVVWGTMMRAWSCEERFAELEQTSNAAHAQLVDELRQELKNEQELIRRVKEMQQAAAAAPPPAVPMPPPMPIAAQAPAAPVPAPVPAVAPVPLPPPPPPPPPAPAPVPAPAPAPVPAPVPAPANLRGAGAGAGHSVLLVICHNRPHYLKRALEGVARVHPVLGDSPGAAQMRSQGFAFPIVISQDGHERGTAQAAQAFVQSSKERAPELPVVHMEHEQARAPTGYHKLAQHFKWALDRVFLHPGDLDARLGAGGGVGRVVILEEDLDVAPDFFDYFAAMAPVLDRDPTLYAVSAWNDNGQAAFVGDPQAVVRSDFFPGLGWMMNRAMWAELGPKWPTGYWDDWMRLDEHRRGRATVRPEVCRTFTFGEQGVSSGQFYGQYLGKIKLNDQPVPWLSLALDGLEKSNYDAPFVQRVRQARIVSVAELRAAAPGAEDLRVNYNDLERSANSYARLAKQIGIMADIKAGVPRGAYMGVIPFRVGGHQVYLAPASM